MQAQIDDQLIAVPQQVAARALEVSERRLAAWVHQGRFGDAFYDDAKLYTFDELVEFAIVSRLLDRFSIRRVFKFVRRVQEAGYLKLQTLSVGMAGDEIVFRHPNGSWEGDRKEGQILMIEVLPLEEIRVVLRQRISARAPADIGRVEKRRGVLSSSKVFAGTRVPLNAVIACLRSRASDVEILEAFPALHPVDIEFAKAVLETGLDAGR